MKFYGIKQDKGIFFNALQSEARQKYLRSLKDGASIIETITKQKVSKTYQQVKTFWGMVIAMTLEEFNDRGWDTSYLLNMKKPTGVAISKELLKEYLYAVCPVFDDDGKRVTLSQQTIEQAMKQLDDIRNFLASQWGIYIPEPDPKWKEKKQYESAE